MFPCEIKQEVVRPTLAIRFRAPVGDLAKHFGVAYGAIITYLETMGERPAGAAFATYFNMDMESLDVEAGFPVAHRIPGKDEISAGEMPAGPYAVCHYVGPYGDLSEAYETLTHFVTAQGYTPVGIVYEWYLDGPDVAPEKTRTDIAFPVVKVDTKEAQPH